MPSDGKRRDKNQSDSVDGLVQEGMVAVAGQPTIEFPTPFRHKPQVQAIIVLRHAANDLQEGAVLKAESKPLQLDGGWKKLEIKVSKHSGESITNLTQVRVTWIALADQ